MTISVSIRAEFATTTAMLTGMIERAGDMRTVMSGPVRAFINEIASKQFQTKGAFLGHPWAPNTAATSRIKARLGINNGPLEGTGKLRRAWEGGQGAIDTVGTSSFTRTIALDYGAYNERDRTMTEVFGNAMRSPRFVAKREVFPEGEWPTSVMDRFNAMILSHVMG